MEKQICNIHALCFAQRVGGTLESDHGLHLVTYHCGAIPSVAYWLGTSREPVRDVHFLTSLMRDLYIERLLSEHRRSVLLRTAQRLKRRLCLAALSILS